MFESTPNVPVLVVVDENISICWEGFLFLGDMDGLSLANGTENGEPRLRFIANSSDIRNRFLSDVRYTWDDDDCSTLDAWLKMDPMDSQPNLLLKIVGVW